MDFFLPSDVARLILGYLKENGYKKTHSCFLRECPHLQEYYKMLMDGRELQTTILGFSLILILEEWGRLKQGNAATHTSHARPVNRRRVSVSPSGRRSNEGSPQKQPSSVRTNSPRWTPHVRFAASSSDEDNLTSDQPEAVDNCDKGFPVLKNLLHTVSKQSTNVSILPLVSSGNSIQIDSPRKDTHRTEQASLSNVLDASTNTEQDNDNDMGDCVIQELETMDTGVVASPVKQNRSGNSGTTAVTEDSPLTAIAKATDPPVASLHKTPIKSTAPPPACPGPIGDHLVTPIKLFHATASDPSSTRSPRRKKPKTPKKRSSDAGNHSGSEEVPEPVFKKILEDNRLHEKLAETCNSYLESIVNNSRDKESNNSRDKEPSVSPHPPEEVDTVPNSKSLEEILDMDTNFVGDLISENIDMSDPAYESLFKLFGKEKETFYEELRREKNKTEEMTKQVEELEKSLQQEIEQYNSPLHSIEAASLGSPDANPPSTSSLLPGVAPLSSTSGLLPGMAALSSTTDNTPSFLPSLADQFGSPLHCSTQKSSADNMLCSPSSVVTQPFSPHDYSQVCSPATPYSQTMMQQPASPAMTPTRDGNDSAVISIGQFGSLTSPQSQSGGTAGSHIHQSTPVRPKHQQNLLEHCITNCSPLAKADMNAGSPVMVQKNGPFTPKSAYTPHYVKQVFTPTATNRPLFSPPAQIVPDSPLSQAPQTDGVNLQTNMQHDLSQISEVAHHTSAMSVHGQSYSYDGNLDLSVVENSLEQSGFLGDVGSQACSTIANHIGCISLPPESPQQPITSKTGKGGKSAKRKGKTKPMKGSSTFTTLKNLLNKPSKAAEDGSSNSSTQHQPASALPDFLLQESEMAARLSEMDVQNQNIILLSPGGSSYKIPVLDYQDDMGLQAPSAEGAAAAETINVWEAELNSSTQYSILPENQLTQGIVTSIEQGNSTEVISKIQTKKKGTEKSKSSKADKVNVKDKASVKDKVKGKKKKSKKADKSGYFESPAGAVEETGNAETDVVYIASPADCKKAFVRNLDFGFDDSRYRKIMPRPQNVAAPTVVIVNNSVPVDTVASVVTTSEESNSAPGPMVCNSPIPNSAVIIVDNNPQVLATAQQQLETVISSVEPVTSDHASNIESHATNIESTSDKQLTNCDQTNNATGVDTGDKESNVNAAEDKGNVVEGDAQGNDSFGAVSEVESYKDWKGKMKARAGHSAGIFHKQQAHTSTPLHVSDSGIDSDLPRQSSADHTNNTVTPKAHVKQAHINNFFKRSSPKVPLVDCKATLLKRCKTSRDADKNEKGGSNSKATKLCSSASKSRQSGKKKSPSKTGAKAISGHETTTDNSSSFELSKGNKGKTKKVDSDTSSSSSELVSPRVVREENKAKEIAGSSKLSTSSSRSNVKGQKKTAAVVSTKRPTPKHKLKKKKKKNSLLKVKFTGHVGSKSKHQTLNQSKIVDSSKQEVIEFELEEDSSDEDIPLMQLKGKLQSSPPKKLESATPRKSPAQSTSRKSPASFTPRKSLAPPTPRKSPAPSTPRKSPAPSTPRKSPAPSTLRKSPAPSTPRKSPAPSTLRKSPVSCTPRKSPVPCTPRKSPTSPAGEFLSPSKETMLEKVGLTPTKSLPSLAFKSPGRANPLDVLAEWQGSPVSGKKRGGRVTRSRQKSANKGFRSSSTKTRSSARNKTNNTPGRKLFEDTGDCSPAVEKYTIVNKPGEVTEPRATTDSNKRSQVRSLFGDVFDVKASVDSENKEHETEQIDTTKEEDSVAANVMEDELQQALHGIEMDTFSSTVEHEVFDEEERFTATKLHQRTVNYVEKAQIEDDEDEEFSNETKAATDEIVGANLDLRNIGNRNTVDNENRVVENIENQLTDRNSNSCSNGRIETIEREASKPICDMPVLTEVVNDINEVVTKVVPIDAKRQPHVIGDTAEHLNDKLARKEKKKKRHKEKKRKRHSLEASAGTPTTTNTSQETGADTQNTPSTTGPGEELGHSCSRGHNHHHKHHKHHHHHHGKHKKKKSKKRHRDEDDDDEGKERHKSKKQRFEASQALEIVNIDEALSQLYNSSIPAT